MSTDKCNGLRVFINKEVCKSSGIHQLQRFESVGISNINNLSQELLSSVFTKSAKNKISSSVLRKQEFIIFIQSRVKFFKDLLHHPNRRFSDSRHGVNHTLNIIVFHVLKNSFSNSWS